MIQRSNPTTLPLQDFVRRCKQRKRKSKIADSTGAELTGGGLLARALVLRRLLLRCVLSDDEQHVGIMLPSSLGGVVTNMAVSIDRRIAVNLNYTLSADVINFCITQCGIKHVLTSRKFMEVMDFDLDAEIIYLDDLSDRITGLDKLIGGFQAFALPASILERQLGLGTINPDDVLTVVFTSGSTGTPKGSMLTHANIAANIEAVADFIQLTDKDVLIGILPLFHSFGYTMTMWTVMTLNIGGAYHFNPLQSKQVGKLCADYAGTILLATPSFLAAYLRHCTREHFATMEVVFAGAEKLPSHLSDAFEEKFGLRPVEGYGCTEVTTVVSANLPQSRPKNIGKIELKDGTVGRPVPGVKVKVTDLESGEELGSNQQGMLWVTGPSLMKGYIGNPELTREVIKNGWYRTGDVVSIDDDGFITIVGRESRFAKIFGEMVPLDGIEEALNGIIGADEEDAKRACVAAVSSDKATEKLIVIHTAIKQTPEYLRQALLDEGHPHLYVPSADSFHQVEELPLLGTIKLDRKRIQRIAEARFGRAT